MVLAPLTTPCRTSIWSFCLVPCPPSHHPGTLVPINPGCRSRLIHHHRSLVPPHLVGAGRSNPAVPALVGDRRELVPSGGGGRSVQRLLQCALPLLAQRGLKHGAAVLAERLDGLVRGHLLHHEEECGCPRLEQVADLVLERLVDARLADLSHQGTESRAHRDA